MPGFSERKTQLPIVNAGSKLLLLDQSEAVKEKNGEKPKNIKSDTKLITLLRQAIDLFELKHGQGKSYLVRDIRESKKN